MLQIQIDGKEISVEQGTTVIEAAHKLGTYIPHFCYHKKLSIAASCRMCLVEVEKSPKPLPACATPVTDGMVVHTHSTKAREAQEGVMEFLLINHPLDCPVCDQAGECQLQDLAVGYGRSASRYTEEKRAIVGKDMGPLISAEEMSRCIYCTRCVRFTEEITGEQEIGVAFRGEFSQVMPFIGEVVKTELSGNVIDLCPVGALTSKPYRYDSRSWELNRRKSIAAHDSLGSNIIVQTKEHTVRRVLPLENESINECWISDRDRFSYEGLHHESRLQTPKIKQGGEWKNVDWQTALEYVRHTLECIGKEEGKDQIAVWANANNTVEELYLAKKWTQALGITNITTQLRTTDSRVTQSAQGAQWLGQSIEQLGECDAILVVGANLRQEQPLLTARLRRAAKQGTKFSVIASQTEVLNMPLLTQQAIHPNAWANQLMQIAFDEQDIIFISLNQAQRATIILGAEAQNHPDYAAIYLAAQNLAQATGAILGILPQSANSVGADVLGVNQTPIDEMLSQPKKAVLLLNVEPEFDVKGGTQTLNTLKQAGSVLAFTPYESNTLLDMADVLLPITPFSETSGSFINMEGRVQSFHGAVKNLGDSRPLWKILRVLGNIFELEGFDFETSQDVLHEALGKDVDVRALLNNNVPLNRIEPRNNTQLLIRVGGVGMYHTDNVVRRASSLQQTPQAQEPQARIHSNTLAKLGLSNGEVVVAQQEQAQIKVTLCTDDTLPQDVVHLPEHRSNAVLGGMMNVIELRKA